MNVPTRILVKFFIQQDFQYKATRVEADVLYDASKDHIPEKATLYIATDERKKDFFNILKEHYNVYFLDDFKDLVSVIHMKARNTFLILKLSNFIMTPIYSSNIFSSKD